MEKSSEPLYVTVKYLTAEQREVFNRKTAKQTRQTRRKYERQGRLPK